MACMLNRTNMAIVLMDVFTYLWLCCFRRGRRAQKAPLRNTKANDRDSDTSLTRNKGYKEPNCIFLYTA